jgi:hypothetical protein
MVNLINKSGYEGPMGDEFVKHVQLLNDSRIKYDIYSFRVSILITSI